MKFYTMEKKDALKAMQSTEAGLCSKEAEKRLSENGKNKLVAAKKESMLIRFLKQLAEPMTIILLVAAAISAFVEIYNGVASGHWEFPADVVIIMSVVLINALLGVFQESKAEKAIEALQEMSAATTKVIRDGKLMTVLSEDLVVGDLIVLEAGDSVPADARIIECASMKIEEAALTGESVPVDKTDEVVGSEGSDVPLGDRKNMAFMGSTVVYGRGKAVVVGVGMNTEMGKIADALSKAQEGKTPLQVKLAGLSKILTYLVIGICLIIFGVNLIRYGLEFETVISSFMLAISLAVAAIPEGLATVVTIVLSIGVTNMSKRNAIIRKLTAVETLGCTQIICSDKTGTLTQNKMTVVEYSSANLQMLATAMSLCSDAQVDTSGEVTGEPTEAALVKFAFDNGLAKYELEKKAPRIAEAPFDSMRKMMSTVHSFDGEIRQFTKGAPDEILKKCKLILTNDGIRPITDDDVRDALHVNKQYADKALRVLACAYKDYGSAPSDCSPEAIENDLCYIGLVGMIDPVRPEVKPAIDECRTAGIRPIMITGDHIDTAVAIALQLGIISDASEAITGSQLDKISDEEFEILVEKYSVYARVQPEHKTRIVNAWRKKGMVTAMTGDGVNDAPSIKNADIGVGMGITGTDVTKNVADMILADDNFATIVAAAGEGRRIYDNICKSIQFLLASNLSEVLSIFFATLIGFTIFQPVQLLWINLITDCFPALALGMEKAEDGLMKRKPRDSKQGIFANGLGMAVFYQGVLVTAITLASYFIGHFLETGNFDIHQESVHGTTMAFLTLAMCEVFHSFNMRSLHGSIFTIKGQNKWLWGAGILSLALTSAVVLIKPLASVFGMTALGAKEFFVALLLGFAIIPLVETVKLIQRCVAKKKDRA